MKQYLFSIKFNEIKDKLDDKNKLLKELFTNSKIANEGDKRKLVINPPKKEKDKTKYDVHLEEGEIDEEGNPKEWYVYWIERKKLSLDNGYRTDNNEEKNIKKPHEVIKQVILLKKEKKKNPQVRVFNMRGNRSFTPSLIPTLTQFNSTSEAKQNNQKEDILQLLYQEIGKTWRELMNVRFKLLALVPAVSLAILLSLFAEEGLIKTSIFIKAPISLFGLLVSFGIYMYDTRNSELYDDLISRGKKIEEELGVTMGQFRGRPSGTPRLFKKVKFYHDRALKLIYYPTILAWFIAFVLFSIFALYELS